MKFFARILSWLRRKKSTSSSGSTTSSASASNTTPTTTTTTEAAAAPPATEATGKLPYVEVYQGQKKAKNPYLCVACNKKFAKSSLNSHVKAKHRSKATKVQCSLCDQVFSKHTKAQDHVASKHQVADNDVDTATIVRRTHYSIHLVEIAIGHHYNVEVYTAVLSTLSSCNTYYNHLNVQPTHMHCIQQFHITLMYGLEYRTSWLGK